VSGSGKVGFAAGLCVGLLVGSRSGRGLYDKSAATANSLMHDPRVRRGATTAAQRAGDAGTAMAGAAARQVKRMRNGNEAVDEQDTHDASAAESGMDMGSGKMDMHSGKGDRDDARAAARAAGARDASAGMGSMGGKHPTPADAAAASRSGHGHGHKHGGHGADRSSSSSSGSSNASKSSNASAQPRQTGMADGGMGDSARDERAD